MPKIRFTYDPKIPHDMVKEWEGYKKGEVAEVSQDEMERWIGRGVAEEVNVRTKVTVGVVEEKEEEEVKVETKAPISPTPPSSQQQASPQPPKVDPLPGATQTPQNKVQENNKT